MPKQPKWWPQQKQAYYYSSAAWDAGVKAGAQAIILEVERDAYDENPGEPIILDREIWESLRKAVGL